MTFVPAGRLRPSRRGAAGRAGRDRRREGGVRHRREPERGAGARAHRRHHRRARRSGRRRGRPDQVVGGGGRPEADLQSGARRPDRRGCSRNCPGADRPRPRRDAVPQRRRPRRARPGHHGRRRRRQFAQGAHAERAVSSSKWPRARCSRHAGRVLKVPVTDGTVVMSGEPVATSPSRISCCACACRSGTRASSRRAIRCASTARNSARAAPASALSRLVYPQIRRPRGRRRARCRASATISSASGSASGSPPASALGFIVSAGYRRPPASASTTSRLRQARGAVVDMPVQRGQRTATPDMPDALEILAGLHAGDMLVQP